MAWYDSWDDFTKGAYDTFTDPGKIAGVAVGGIAVAGAAALTIATGGAMAPLALAIAGAGLSAGGALIEGDTAADNATELASQNQSLAEKAHTLSETNASDIQTFETLWALKEKDLANLDLAHTWSINANDSITSLAERKLANLERSLTAGRDLAQSGLMSSAKSGTVALQGAAMDADLATGKVLSGAARSGVRMQSGGGSVVAGLVQNIGRITAERQAGEDEMREGLDQENTRINNAWNAGQDQMGEYRAGALESVRSGTLSITKAYDKSIAGSKLSYDQRLSGAALDLERGSLITQQYQLQAESARTNSYLSAAGSMFDLASTAYAMGAFNKAPVAGVTGVNKYDLTQKYQFEMSDDYDWRKYSNTFAAGYRSQ